MRFWAQPYDVENQGGNSQAVYHIEQNLRFLLKICYCRNTVEQVYTLVLEDLEESETLFQEAGMRRSTHALGNGS